MFASSRAAVWNTLSCRAQRDFSPPQLARRSALLILASSFVGAGCAAVSPVVESEPPSPRAAVNAVTAAEYGPIQDGDVFIPGVDVDQIDPRFLR